MPVVIKAITGATWTAITSAGESGTCWVQNKPDKGQVVINHSESGSGSLVVDDSAFISNSKYDREPIPADSASDIFYARCSVAGETADLAVDVI